MQEVGIWMANGSTVVEGKQLLGKLHTTDVHVYMERVHVKCIIVRDKLAH